MAIGRPIPVLTLTDEERDALGRWARRPRRHRRWRSELESCWRVRTAARIPKLRESCD